MMNFCIFGNRMNFEGPFEITGDEWASRFFIGICIYEENMRPMILSAESRHSVSPVSLLYR